MDEENGLLYIRARYYSTKRGRFITKDPTTGKDGDSQSLNRYIYALNNPVRLIDISGLSAQEVSGATISLATSDNSRFHNILISPSTLGLATQPIGTAPILPNSFQNGINTVVAGSTPMTIAGTGNSSTFNRVVSGVTGAGEVVVGFSGVVLGGLDASAGIILASTGVGFFPGVALAAPGIVAATVSYGVQTEGVGNIYSAFSGNPNPVDEMPFFIFLSNVSDSGGADLPQP